MNKLIRFLSFSSSVERGLLSVPVEGEGGRASGRVSKEGRQEGRQEGMNEGMNEGIE